MKTEERLAIRESYANETGESCHVNLARYGDWLEHRLIYQQQLNKDLLEELQMKLIRLSKEFDNDEDYKAVSAKLHTLMNWVKTKKLINESRL